MKQAVILAAGEGTRLKPFTVDKPKAMLSVAGKPIIQYVIEALAFHGIREIIIVAGYKKEQIFDYIGDGKQLGVEVQYVIQSKQLGTAHALLQAKDETRDEFLVLSGNKLIKPETISNIVNAGPPAVLTKKVDNPVDYGIVRIKGGLITEVSEIPGQMEGNLINAGVYSLNRDIFPVLESDLTLPGVINIILRSGEQVKAIETAQTWLDVVYPWDILSLNSILLKDNQPQQNGIIESGVQIRGSVSIGKGTIIRSNSYITGPVIIGKGCDIGPNTCIFPSTTIGNNVIVSAFTELRNSVIGDDVYIASSSTVQDSVIDGGSTLGCHFCALTEETEIKVDQRYHAVRVGAMVGRSCRIGNKVMVQAGTIIGNNTQVKSLGLVNGIIPDRSLVV